MFFFSKNKSKEKTTEQPIVETSVFNEASLRQDTLIVDYMGRIDKNSSGFEAVYVYFSKLQSQQLKNSQRQVILEMFEGVTKKSAGEVFDLLNDDMVVIFKYHVKEEIEACLVKIRFMFSNEQIFKNSEDLVQCGFIKRFNLSVQNEELKTLIKEAFKSENSNKQNEKNVIQKTSQRPLRTLKRELSPVVLAKLQKALAMVDFSSLIRRQSVCAVIGKSAPQPVFDEVFVSIADLRDMLLPDVDLVSNPWLFLHLTETLDKRVLVSLSQHDDGSFTSNFSINLNVSTLLSDEFLNFDENLNASMRSSIVLELQLVDIFSDIKAYNLAKTFAHYRGYRICIDGITVDKLKYINREQLGGDLMKIIWHPSFMDVINEDNHFTDYVNKAERAKMILCRVDDPQAVEVGNALGINLYQGRYIQRLLTSVPKKVIYDMNR